ncbi:MAG: hypothetical protein KF735_07425 [Chelatococcus sp.]|jgi:hypothetical protein|uniref:hypothetical protein n=1 Tax=unclassified Chelatococcus TaxID=2638111 RepID=UPI001BCAF76C|nr:MULTISPECIES: hypothetical protein [unclassified Chelatococcus]CAH1657671.1 conserved hypothetical protein [Hyphomicrobiales bacterium]MBS7742278.1 hypothetical protein [Chelatococcus sp. HY11]MBX3537449.1 hypothetical protein [Chelatococcus sp.]MBX3542604.1 hypothetical protein [Chelatococcus sp.]MCO5075179.1 hypothetical protein [Chelatococcus sp.]
MLNATVATLTRGEPFSSGDVTEPYEAGWASEAVFFARGLDAGETGGSAFVQISPDGIRWCDEGTELALGAGNRLTFARIREFGHFLRLRIELPEGLSRSFLVTIALKS